MSVKSERGKAGELHVSRYLEKNGWRIAGRNYRVKGDSISASIAAASILAKVSRDRYMKELDLKYPEYLFAKHKGYGTKLHYEMVAKYGLCPEHRKSFFRKHKV